MNFHRLYALRKFLGLGGSGGETVLTLEWEQGMLTAEGWEIDHGERIRTVNCLPDGVTRITTNGSYDVVVVFLRTETPGDGGSYYDPHTKQLTAEAVWAQNINLTGISFSEYPKIRLFARKVDSSALSPSDGANITVVKQ